MTLAACLCLIVALLSAWVTLARAELDPGPTGILGTLVILSLAILLPVTMAQLL